MKKILITGGAGYVGSVLSEYLLDSNYEVTVLDNLMYNQLSLLHLFSNKNFRFVRGDVRDIELLRDLILQNDVIIPLAAIVGAPACDKNKNLATEVNYVQIKNILYCMSAGQMLIMPNTNSQYGSSDEVVTEDSPTMPLSHYAGTKCMAESLIMEGGNGICLRLATVFGVSPRMRTDLLVNDFVYKAMTDGFLVLYESHFKRNYIHVRDVAKAFLFCIKNYKKMNNEVFNVGLSDANLTKKELALRVKKYLPDTVVIEKNFDKDQDKRNYVVSNEKLENTGWYPECSLDDGIRELIDANQMIINKSNKLFTNL